MPLPAHVPYAVECRPHIGSDAGLNEQQAEVKDSIEGWSEAGVCRRNSMSSLVDEVVDGACTADRIALSHEQCTMCLIS